MNQNNDASIKLVLNLKTIEFLASHLMSEQSNHLTRSGQTPGRCVRLGLRFYQIFYKYLLSTYWTRVCYVYTEYVWHSS